jgi:hypothetical protein
MQLKLCLLSLPITYKVPLTKKEKKVKFLILKPIKNHLQKKGKKKSTKNANLHIQQIFYTLK